MRAVMSLISRDIRRAGTRELAWRLTLGTPNPFSTAVAWRVSNMTGAAAKSCVRLAYSVTNDDGAAASNRYGYRLSAAGNGVIETYNHTASQWNCNGTGWQGVSDPNIAWIQSLVFTVSTEPGMSGVAVRTVVINLRAGTNTRSTTPSAVTASDCAKVDVVCRRMVEKIRIRNDAVL
jgi:type II secretory pathway component PulJ